MGLVGIVGRGRAQAARRLRATQARGVPDIPIIVLAGGGYGPSTDVRPHGVPNGRGPSKPASAEDVGRPSRLGVGTEGVRPANEEVAPAPTRGAEAMDHGSLRLRDGTEVALRVAVWAEGA